MTVYLNKWNSIFWHYVNGWNLWYDCRGRGSAEETAWCWQNVQRARDASKYFKIQKRNPFLLLFKIIVKLQTLSALVCVMAEITWFRQLLDYLQISSLEMWNVGSEMETLPKTQRTWELKSFAKAVVKLIAFMKLDRIQVSKAFVSELVSQS